MLLAVSELARFNGAAPSWIRLHRSLRYQASDLAAHLLCRLPFSLAWSVSPHAESGKPNQCPSRW